VKPGSWGEEREKISGRSERVERSGGTQRSLRGVFIGGGAQDLRESTEIGINFGERDRVSEKSERGVESPPMSLGEEAAGP